MGKAIDSGADAIVMDDRDHVATALRDLEAGATITFKHVGQSVQLEVAEAIAFGHKISIADIEEGVHVRKYGEVIGRATVAIAKGHHVHVHNIEGIRGRGDQAKAAVAEGE